jgi:hypothetical protein
LIIFLLFAIQRFRAEEFVWNVTRIQKKTPFITYEITRYPSNISIVAVNNISLGFVTDPWNLNFGKVTKGGNITRYISIKNKEEKKVLVKLEGKGNISKILSFEKNKFILNGGENINISITAVTKDVDVGIYAGEVDVTIEKPNFDFIYFIWNIYR